MMRVWRLSNVRRLPLCLSVCLPASLSVEYIRPRSRTERPGKTKIGTEVTHVTRDSDTTFKVRRSKVNLQGAGHIVAASRTACYISQIFSGSLPIFYKKHLKSLFSLNLTLLSAHLYPRIPATALKKLVILLCPRPIAMMRVWHLPVCRVHRAYIENRKPKIGTEEAHDARDSDTTFKVRRSKVNFANAEREGVPDAWGWEVESTGSKW